MNLFYAAMWLVAGVVLIFNLSKENRAFYFVGAFFILLGAWWGADHFTEVDLFAGGWGIALKVITLAALIVCIAVFVTERRRNMAADRKKED